MKLSRRQKRILKRKLKRIAGDAVAVIVGAGMFVGLLIAWANEPMPDWSEYTEENHIGMVQVEGSDTWLTQEEYEQMCKERDAYKAAEQAEEQSYYNAILQSTETPVPTTTAAIGSLDWDADDSYRLAKIAMAEAEGEDTEGKALVIYPETNTKKTRTNRKEVTNNENGNEGRTDTHKRSRQCPVHNHKELGKDEVEQADADTKRTG